MLKPRMPISEIFKSLQGEGRNTGATVIFLRFRGCNLDCSFCDTKYAWQDKHRDKIIQTSFTDVIQKIRDLDCKHVVFTGGEPSLYEPFIEEIQIELERGDKEEWTWEIETNGSRELQNYYDLVNVSYKTNNSGVSSYELKAIFEKYDYKFVVDSKETLYEIEEIIKSYSLPRKNIVLMPLGTTKASQDRMDLARYCVDNNYRYCPRQHINWFGYQPLHKK